MTFEDPRITDLKRVKEQLENNDRSTTQNLSGDTSNQDPVDMQMMRKHWPNYPYHESEESCPFCNKILKNGYVAELIHGFKLIIKDKDTHEIRGTIPNASIDKCDYCGRKVSVSVEGIKWQ